MAKKRAPGEGSIHQRQDGRWEASRTIGRTAGGNPRRLRAYGRTKAAALGKLERMIVDLGGLAGGTHVPDTGGLTVRGLLERWLAMKEGVAKLKATTLDSYRWYLATYVLPAVGHIPLRRLRPAHVQELLAELGRRQVADRRKRRPGVELPPLPDRPLSPRVVRYVWTLLHGALRHAVRLQLLRVNPCDQVEPPRGGRARPPLVWTPEEVERLLAAARATSPALHPLYYLAVTTGARRGELLGLEWGDVDLVGGVLDIRRSMDASGRVSTPKTAAGERRVTITPEAVEVLRQHQVGQLERRRLALEAGIWQETALVFASSTGRPLSARNLLHNLTRLCRRAGIPRHPFHALRHTAATLALRSGVSARALADRLGHRDPGLTLRVYTHVLQEQAREAALPLAELLHGRHAAAAAEAADEVN